MLSKTFKLGLFGLVIFLLAIGAATYAWNSLSVPRRWERGYDRIAEGDSAQKVLDIMGKPGEAKDCSDFRYTNEELWRECAEQYRYFGFMGEWVFVIGKNRKVVAKWHSVSP